jgi:nucleotide-binding universal stress UspA family protein
MRKCPCGVWLRLAGAREAPATVIAAVDVDEWDASEPETLADLNRRVIRSAMALSGPGGAVHVLHAWDAPGEGLVSAFADGREARAAADRYVREVEAARHMALDALIADLRPAGEAAPRLLPRLARGPARRVIPETARTLGADTVVMGTVARTGLAGVLIGNTAEDILNTVDCSVLTVKPAGFVSPLATG